MSHTNGIGASPLLTTLLGQTERTGGTSAQKGAVLGGTVASADSAQLSSTASVLSKAVASTSDVRSDKVASLKAAIDSGSYKVSAHAVADKLIDSMLR